MSEMGTENLVVHLFRGLNSAVLWGVFCIDVAVGCLVWCCGNWVGYPHNASGQERVWLLQVCCFFWRPLLAVCEKLGSYFLLALKVLKSGKEGAALLLALS